MQHTNTSSTCGGSTTSLFYRDLGARWLTTRSTNGIRRSNKNRWTLSNSPIYGWWRPAWNLSFEGRVRNVASTRLTGPKRPRRTLTAGARPSQGPASERRRPHAASARARVAVPALAAGRLQKPTLNLAACKSLRSRNRADDARDERAGLCVPRHPRRHPRRHLPLRRSPRHLRLHHRRPRRRPRCSAAWALSARLKRLLMVLKALVAGQCRRRSRNHRGEGCRPGERRKL